MTRAVIEQAIAAMEGADYIDVDMKEAIAALRALLDAPEPVPVAVQSAYTAGMLAGLEEAAKECMSWHSAWIDCQGTYEFRAEGAEHCADAIRNLAKETPCAS